MLKTTDYTLLILSLQLGLTTDALNYLLLGFQSSLNIYFLQIKYNDSYFNFVLNFSYTSHSNVKFKYFCNLQKKFILKYQSKN